MENGIAVDNIPLESLEIKRYYNAGYRNKRFYDLVVDASLMPVEEVVDKIKKLILKQK